MSDRRTPNYRSRALGRSGRINMRLNAAKTGLLHAIGVSGRRANVFAQPGQKRHNCDDDS